MRATRALVLYESLFGNTSAIAAAIADGVRQARPGAEVDVRQVDDSGPLPGDVDLVVVGAPTHFWGLTRPVTRAMERQYERRAVPRVHAGGATRRRADATIGMRSGIAALPAGGGRAAAAFDTRMTGPLTGGAGREIARRIERAGYRLVAEPRSFFVEAVPGPLCPGETERARAWGASLAESLDRHRPDRRDTAMQLTSDHAVGAVSTRIPDTRAAEPPPPPRGPVTVDLTRILTTAEVVVGAVLVARALARRPGSSKALVTMGPGGWVSMKGGTVAVRRGSRPWGRRKPIVPVATGRAPLWARVLSAVPLQALTR